MSYTAFVCLLATAHNTTDCILMKTLPDMYLWRRKNWLNFRSHPHPAPGVFLMIIRRCEIWGIFPQYGSYLWKKCLHLPEDFITDVGLFLVKEGPVKFWKWSGYRVSICSPSGSKLQIQTRISFALAKVFFKLYFTFIFFISNVYVGLGRTHSTAVLQKLK